MSDVTINYKGSAISTMDASGTKTLETEGKYCEDDIEVVYVKPAGGGGAITIDDTADPAGGVVRTITAVDISDTTATAADVINSKYFYTADGTKTQGTGTGGITPTGTKNISISSNGTTTEDVTNYASVSISVAVPIVTYYTGSSTPSSSLGSNGDIYLQTGS